MLRPLIGLDKTITSSSLLSNVSDLPLELLVDRYDKILRARYHEHIRSGQGREGVSKEINGTVLLPV